MIYLDCAATTLEKPNSVVRAVSNAIKQYASPGRGGHRAAMRAGELLLKCRESAAELFEVPSPEQVVLTMNATHGLNIAIKTLVQPGMTVLISGFEHNAVTRALHSIPDVKVKVVCCPLFDQAASLDGFRAGMTNDVNVVICNHVSNVFGFIQPVDRIAALCQERGKPLIIDASQSAGMLPVSLKKWKAAFIAMPGHKGLFGPQGTGLLLCGAEAKPLICGGTGSDSLLQEMPDYLPDRLEAGTQNVCGAAGVFAGLDYVKRLGTDRIGQHECSLRRLFTENLRNVSGIELFEGENQSGLLSFRIANRDCEEIGDWLGRKGVAVRAGLHCAPLAHDTAGTLSTGTVRVSFSPFNHAEQVHRACELICHAASGDRAL